MANPIAAAREPVLASRTSMSQRRRLTEKELVDLRASLVRERDELTAQFRELDASSTSAGDPDLPEEARHGDDVGESATATFERERDLSVENNVRDLLRKIDGALARMERGVYGLCERCEKPIEKPRLKALPYANLCIEHAQAASRAR
jgi:DnaK suppressor protein